MKGDGHFNPQRLSDEFAGQWTVWDRDETRWSEVVKLLKRPSNLQLMRARLL